MKKIALILNYASFIALFLSLLTESCLLLQSIKYVLLIVAAYMLFRITNVYGGRSLFHRFNYGFMSISFLFVIYALVGKSALYTNIVIQFVVASIIGFGLSLMYEEPVKRVRKTDIRPPARPKARKVKKTTKRASKKTASKRTAKKATKKKSTKKTSAKKTSRKAGRSAQKSASRTKTSGKRRGPGRPPKNKSAKKASKKTTKKSRKKSTKKASKKAASKKSSTNKK